MRTNRSCEVSTSESAIRSAQSGACRRAQLARGDHRRGRGRDRRRIGGRAAFRITEDGRDVVFARGGQVVRHTLDGDREDVLLDVRATLGGWGQEPFPRASRDAQWLVWAASAGGHEPRRADYEIFLWKVGEPWQKALRITYHTGNDQWPDITR